MLRPSEVWTRAANEGRECPYRMSDGGSKHGNYLALNVPGITYPLCALGFLIEPYREDRVRWSGPKPILDVLADLYGTSPQWMHEAEYRYEGQAGHPRHSLLELAAWAEAQGH